MYVVGQKRNSNKFIEDGNQCQQDESDVSGEEQPRPLIPNRWDKHPDSHYGKRHRVLGLG